MLLIWTFLFITCTVVYGEDNRRSSCILTTRHVPVADSVNQIKMAVKSKQHIVNNKDHHKDVNYEDLLDSLYIACILFMTLILLRQRQHIQSLKKEIRRVKKRFERINKLLTEMQDKINAQGIWLKEYCSRLDDLDEKLDKVILEIEKRKKERTWMKKCLMEWKHDWMEQSHKIQEIKTDYMEQLPELSNTDIDQLIEEQKNVIRKHNDKWVEKFKEFQKIDATFIKILETLQLIIVQSILYDLITVAVMKAAAAKQSEE